MKKIFFLSLLCALMHFSAKAQTSPPASKTYKYGTINPEEFKIMPSGQDSAADAIKLFDIGSCSFKMDGENFGYVFERHVRIKIIKKSAYDWGNLSVTLYSNNSGQEKLESITGATYNLENGKVVESKLSKDAKFSEQYNKNYQIKKITLPNIQEGSIVEFKYRIKSDFIYALREWNFQTSIPTLLSEYTVSIPEYYAYKINPVGYWPIVLAEEFTTPQNFTYSSSTSAAETFSANVMNRRYIAEKVPAFKDEPFITTDDDYICKLEFELHHTNFPGSGYKEYTSSWEKITKTLLEEENFGQFLNKSNPIKTQVAEIVKSEQDPEKKMRLIFDYVKSNIKWNDEFRMYTSQTNPKTILDKKTGSSADINLTLIALLKTAGLEAEPMLISTRSNGNHPGHPMLTKFNSVIAVAYANGQKFYLDAINKNNYPGFISYQNLNHKGLCVNITEKKSEWSIFKDSVPSRSSYYYSLDLNKDDNSLKGKLFMSSSDYEALKVREKFQAATNQDEFLKNYRKDKAGLQISGYKMENLDVPSEKLVQSMDVKIDDVVEEAGDLVYFTPLLFERTKENPFKLDTRNFPVDFAYPQEETYRIIVKLPENYKIDKIPKSESIVLPDKSASYTYIFTNEGNVISITSRISLLKSVYSADEYFDLKELFKNIVRKQSEQIVLKKG